MKRANAIVGIAAVLGIATLVTGLPSRRLSDSAAPTDGARAILGPERRPTPRPTWAPSDEPEPIAVHGRVVDDRRWPVAGASVTLRLSGAPAATARSGPDGTFRVETAPRRWPGKVSGGVFVADRAGRVALEPVDLVVRGLGPVNFGTIEVGPSHLLRVRTEAGASVLVSAVAGRVLVPLATATADSLGHAKFRALPKGAVYVSAADRNGNCGRVEVTLPATDPNPLSVTWGWDCGIRVRVTEERTDEPIPGARVTARLHLPDTYRTVEPDPAVVAGETDFEGWTTVTGVCHEDEILLDATADGWIPADHTFGWRHLIKVGRGSAGVRLARPRALTFPVREGEWPAPLDGTVLQVRPGSAAARAATARMRGNAIEVSGLAFGDVRLLAVAPDGSVAELHSDPFGREPAETAFRRARRVEIRVTEDGRVGIPGIAVRVGGSAPWGDVKRTGPDGVAVIDGLPAEFLSVHAGMTPEDGWGFEAGNVDLTEGDGRLDVSLGPVREACIRVHVGGEARLPSGLRWDVPDAVFLEAHEDPEAGLLNLRFRAREATPSQEISVSASGFRRAVARYDWERAGTTPVADLFLERLGTLVTRIAARPGTRFDALVEVRSSEEKLWIDHGPAYEKRGEYRAEDLEPGTYRVHDLESGLSSREVVVRSGQTAEVFLDLTGTYEAYGEVVVLDGGECGRARLVISGEGIEGRSGEEHGKDIHGGFAVTLPAGRPVTLRVSHPTLLPDGDAATAVVTGPGDPIVLRLLSSSPMATFRAVSPSGSPIDGEYPVGSIALFAAEPRGPPSAYADMEIRAGVGKIRGFTPGTWTLWVCLDRYAPRTLRGIVLGSGRTDLGEVAFERGSVVHVRPLATDRNRVPDLDGSSQHDGLGYVRGLWSDGKDLRFTGLGPGKFHVSLTWTDSDREPHESKTAIEVDGCSDYTIEVDTR